MTKLVNISMVCYIYVTLVTRRLFAQTTTGEVCSYTFTAPKDGNSCPSLGQVLDRHRETNDDLTELKNALQALIEEFETWKRNCPCTGNSNPTYDQILADDVIAWYTFDGNANDQSGNGHHGNPIGSVTFAENGGISGKAASFNGFSKINVESLRNFHWGSSFSVSVWFKRTGQYGNYQGVVSNGYYTSGSWEIRMEREFGGQMLGGGVVTSNDRATWNYVNLVAANQVWHHVVMTYDGESLKYYLDNVQQEGDDDCCHGDMLIKNTPLTIGQAGAGKSNEYFYGLIDEVVIFSKVLSDDDVSTIFNKLNPQ